MASPSSRSRRDQTKNVKIRRKDYPNEGIERASWPIRLQSGGRRSVVVTDKANGKVMDTEDIGLSADLNTLTITAHIPARDKPIVMVFERK
jgi:hypothetical protein